MSGDIPFNNTGLVLNINQVEPLLSDTIDSQCNPSEPIVSSKNTTHKKLTDLDTDINNKVKTTTRKYTKRNKTNDIITYEYYKECIHPIFQSESKRKARKPFIYKNQLVNTLKMLKLPFNKTDKKEEMEMMVFSLYKKLASIDNSNIVKIINLYKTNFREKIRKRKTKLYGPGFVNKSLCKNQEDCFSMETIDEIDDCYFFSIKDNHNSIFFFDIRTFNKLIKTKSKNPYTREEFNKESLDLFNYRKNIMEKNNISIIYKEEKDYLDNLSPQEKIKNRIFDIFQTIDELNAMAGGTRIEWFQNLSIQQLKLYYKVLEDIWNYRANLSTQQKEAIVPNNNMFPYSVNYMFCQNNVIKIQNIILTEMEKLINSSPDMNNRSTGAYYILIAFTEVSMECAQDMPWLIQY